MMVLPVCYSHRLVIALTKVQKISWICSTPLSFKDQSPWVITLRRNLLVIRLVKESANMLAPPTHLTWPPVKTKSRFSIVKSIAVRLSSMWAEVFRHLLMVSNRDLLSVTAINGVRDICCSQFSRVSSFPMISFNMKRYQWTLPIPCNHDCVSADNVFTVQRFNL